MREDAILKTKHKGHIANKMKERNLKREMSNA